MRAPIRVPDDGGDAPAATQGLHSHGEGHCPHRRVCSVDVHRGASSPALGLSRAPACARPWPVVVEIVVQAARCCANDEMQ